MKRLVTGLDDEGRSCVVSAMTFSTPQPSMVVDTFFAATDLTLTPRRPGRARFHDVAASGWGVAVGGARWLTMWWPPGVTSPMHYTDTVDFVSILEGGTDLILDDGAHHLEAGDCVVVTGVDHSWVAGPEGCAVASLLVGIPVVVE